MRPVFSLLPASLLLACPACVVTPRGRVIVAAPIPVVGFAYVDREPPPARYERPPAPPTVEHFWVAGHWAWSANAYVWVPGAYHSRPRPGTVWVDGHWARHERGWYWTEGHWR
jgi:WXXGXW repeat (2 copies)